MDMAGYKREGRLKINEDVKMAKNARRMKIMLFGLSTDWDFKPRSIDGYYYFFSGDPAVLKTANRVAVSEFSRKGHMLLIVSPKSLPDKIIRGED